MPCAFAVLLMLVLFLHLVEEKVKEQLEAAKPEPIIDEVVGTLGAALCLAEA